MARTPSVISLRAMSRAPVTPPTASQGYENNEQCDITVSSAVRLQVKHFDTESCCDRLTVPMLFEGNPPPPRWAHHNKPLYNGRPMFDEDFARPEQMAMPGSAGGIGRRGGRAACRHAGQGRVAHTADATQELLQPKVWSAGAAKELLRGALGAAALRTPASRARREKVGESPLGRPSFGSKKVFERKRGKREGMAAAAAEVAPFEPSATEVLLP